MTKSLNQIIGKHMKTIRYVIILLVWVIISCKVKNINDLTHQNICNIVNLVIEDQQAIYNNLKKVNQLYTIIFLEEMMIVIPIGKKKL
jgi:hypothetical protein